MVNEGIKIYCDGGARGNPGPAAAAFVITKNDEVLYKGSKYLGKATNNYAEHYAVAEALSWLINDSEIGDGDISFFLDSELVVSQLNGRYKIKSNNLRPLAIKSKELEKKFTGKIFFNYIPRSKNKLADELVNVMIDKHLKK